MKRPAQIRMVLGWQATLHGRMDGVGLLQHMEDPTTVLVAHLRCFALRASVDNETMALGAAKPMSKYGEPKDAQQPPLQWAIGGSMHLSANEPSFCRGACICYYSKQYGHPDTHKESGDTTFDDSTTGAMTIAAKVLTKLLTPRLLFSAQLWDVECTSTYG
ncbi:MAG: hypothetical protein LQ345_002999 [Seirophora villosa]|nr:MAG: hypothetical protein LQ345_002999 [Seirophora villosa]